MELTVHTGPAFFYGDDFTEVAAILKGFPFKKP